jgi:hypothetical protein
VISLNLVLAELRLGLKNHQVGEKWVSDDCSYLTPQATVDISLLKSEAMSIVKKFGATLKPQLKSALKSGGAVNAVSVCAVVAPQVAKQINNEKRPLHK